MSNKGSLKNSSGCWDMTAHDAIENIAKEDEKFKKLVSTFFTSLRWRASNLTEGSLWLIKRLGGFGGNCIIVVNML
jgi:hypothetical protein